MSSIYSRPILWTTIFSGSFFTLALLRPPLHETGVLWFNANAYSNETALYLRVLIYLVDPVWWPQVSRKIKMGKVTIGGQIMKKK